MNDQPPKVDGVATGGVAVEDLEDEQVDGVHRVEQAMAPGVPLAATSLDDRPGGEERGEVLREAAEDDDNARRHGGAPSGVVMALC